MARQPNAKERSEGRKESRTLPPDGKDPESYVPPTEFRKYRALARGWKKFVDKRSDFKNEVNSLLDQDGITYNGSLWSDEGREFLAELTLEEPSQLMLDHWLEAIDEFTEKINRIQREIEETAAAVDELDTLMIAPGIAAYSGLGSRRDR